MKIKVCGMREGTNIADLLTVEPDYMGFIFFEKSPRFVGSGLDAELLRAFPKRVKKVGVFVNVPADTVLKNVKKYSLDLVQLHGEETPDYCRNLKSKGVSIIKAFSLDNNFNFSQLNNFKPHADYFLFDAKGQNRGGNGIAFDWALLSKYDNDKPFFLAGGVDAENIKNLGLIPAHLKLHALDVNSKFETAPAVKDIDKLRGFIAEVEKL